MKFQQKWHLVSPFVLLLCGLVRQTCSVDLNVKIPLTFDLREKLPTELWMNALMTVEHGICDTMKCDLKISSEIQSSFRGDEIAVVNTNLEFNPFHLEVIHDGGKTKLIPCGNDSCTKINSWERKCLKCDSRDNPKCVDEVDDTMSEFCLFADEDLGCFHIITDSKVVRGCVVELEGSEKQKCLANDDSCRMCFEVDGCNRQENFTECFVNDQPFTNALPPYVFDTKSSPKICAKYNDTCFIQLLENDTVIRGCVDEYAAQNDLPSNFLSESGENGRTYQVCSTPLCNEKQLMATFCLSCNSNFDSKCKEKPSNSKKCPLEFNPSGCYHFDNGSYVERGCIVELNEEQRVNCESDSENCKKCNNNECNNKIKFMSCLSQNSKQKAANRTTCKHYDNECFIHVHLNSENVRRGCLNDLNSKGYILSDCRNNPEICELCSENDCNSRSLPEEYCYSCNSRKSMDCKYGVAPDQKVKCPGLKRFGCYMWHESPQKFTNEFVERGCVSKLDIKTRNMCQTPSINSTCKTCEGDGCNGKTFFQTCVDCSSEIDENCIECQKTMKGAKVRTRQCENYMDQCYTHVEHGIVTRNCTDPIINTHEKCASDPDHCLVCSSGLCNGHEVIRDICVSCDSDTNPQCRSTSNITDVSLFTEFPLSINNKGCFHFVDTKNDHHIRGHVSQLSDEELKKYSRRKDEFRICKEAKCNFSPFLPKCFVCDSAEDPNCGTNPNSSHIQVCQRYGNRCFTAIFNDKVLRGCLDDADYTMRSKCGIEDGKCDICSTTKGPGCNDLKLNMETCVECWTSIDTRCRTHPELMKNKICDKFQPIRRSGCFLKIEGDKVNRGCLQDLEPANATDCLGNSDTCKSCTGSKCNTKVTFQECYSCNGREDPECAKSNEFGNTEICKDYHSTCGIGIDERGFTHRRCINESSKFDEEFTNKTFTCNENKCNVVIFPKDRLKCYQCNGDEECSDTSLKPEPCGIYTTYDQCFTYIDADKEMFRGCLSDATKVRLLCEQKNKSNKGTCVLCSNTGCNNQPKERQPELTCVNCTGSEECAFGYNASMAISCEKNVALGDEESCFTRLINGTGQVERGCTLDIDSPLNGEYKTCSEPGCNIENVRFSWCLRCKSGTNGNCSVVQNPLEYIKHCDHSFYPYDKRGCFTTNQDGIITRGCTADLTVEEYDKCNGEDESCSLCTDDYCNKEAISASMKISANLLLCSSVFVITYIHRS